MIDSDISASIVIDEFDNNNYYSCKSDIFFSLAAVMWPHCDRHLACG